MSLLRVAEDGLPGEHHLYITFRTEHEGVKLLWTALLRNIPMK